MYDYRNLEALCCVWEEGGFEKAAERLCLTQSAVSQRIKSLEEEMGQILISRSTPPRPTARGEELIRHYRQVILLEGELKQNTGNIILPLGINADSLASWFLPALESVLDEGDLQLDLHVDDQEHTVGLLKRGVVAGCVSASSRTVQGCRIHRLGTMNYIMAASPDFRDKWFPRGFDIHAVQKAPAVVFNRRDGLHRQYLKTHLSDFSGSIPVHYIPSPEQFLNFVLEGRAYGMVPLLQCARSLDAGRLLHLAPESLGVDLYWQHWNLESPLLEKVTAALTGKGRELLSLS